MKRHGADIKVANYIACLVTSGRTALAPKGCRSLGWGLVDIHRRYVRLVCNKITIGQHRYMIYMNSS